MSKYLRNSIALLGFLIVFSSVDARDYESFPVLDYAFEHLDAELELNAEERSISGTVTYTVRARNTMAGALMLMASGIEIDVVLINEEEAEFEMENGYLNITVPDRLIESGREFLLSVRYAAPQTSALLKTAGGTLFTTFAPHRRAEWIPVYEHPRVEMTTRMAFLTPRNHEVVSNGYFESSGERENGGRRTVWKSDIPISSTDLAFFSGRLTFKESILGTKSVRIYAEQGVLSDDRHQQMLRETARKLGEVQRRLRFELPFDGLSVVVLRDHLWEAKPYAASLGHIGLNSTGLDHQLSRIVAAQWFGAWHRSETLSEMESQLLLQAALLHSEGSSIPDIELYDFPDTPEFTAHDGFRSDHFGKWMTALREMPDFQRDVITRNLQQIIRNERRVNSWNDYMKIWYEQTGRPVEKSEPARQVSEAREQTIKRVNLVIEKKEDGKLLIITDLRDELENDSLRVPLLIFGRQGDPQQRTLTFYRTGGEQLIDIEGSPANVTTDISRHPGIEFVEMKDLDMWLHQLRSDPEPKRRAEAARMMPRFRDDPDIQLAMQDFLRREESPEVRTAMIRALSDIVEGASGTQQVFIEMSGNAQGEELIAAMDALWHYEGNPNVISAVGRVAQQSDYVPAAVTALGVFRHIASEEQFNELSRSVLLSSRPPAIRAAAIEELFRMDDLELAVGTSLDIVYATEFPYAMRATALQMLVRYDRNEELREVLPELAGDPDPRIRYMVLSRLDRLPANQMNDLLETIYNQERDPRVRSAFDEFY